MTQHLAQFRWRSHGGGLLRRGSPAVSPNGTVYVGSDDGCLHAFSPHGEKAWTCRVGGKLGNSTAAVGDDGVLYVTTETGVLSALSAEGKLLWMAQGGWLARTTPALAEDGTAVFGARRVGGHTGRQSHVVAVNRAGVLAWTNEVVGSVLDGIAIAANGTIYAGTDERYLYAIGRDGTLLERCRIEGRISAPLALGAGDTVLVPTRDRGLSCLRPDLSQAWAIHTADMAHHCSPATGENGTIYFGALDHFLYAVSAEGKLCWRFPAVLAVSSSPCVAADGTVYFGSQDNCLYAVRRDGSIKWKLRVDGPVVSSPAILDEGDVVCALKSGIVFALDERNGGPALSPWPMLHGNARRSGVAGVPSRSRMREAAGPAAPVVTPAAAT